MENDQPKGFQVKDRRRFTESGDPRPGSEERDADPSPVAAEAKPAAGSAAADVKPAAAPARPERPPVEITLSTFLISLSTQALMCLGEIPDPMTGETTTDLVAVRELIDIISMLQEKTRGGADETEARLFEKILYDLRIRFVEKHRQ